MLQAEVHAPKEPPKAEIPIEPQAPDETLDQTGHPLTPKYPIPGELWVPEPFEQP